MAFTFIFMGVTFQNCAKDLDMSDYASNLGDDIDPTELVPRIDSSPLTYSAVLGQPMDLIVNASGPNLVYQWSKDGVAQSQFNTGTLTVSSVQNSDAGSYTLEVSNSYGTRTVVILVTITSTAGQVAPSITSITAPVRSTLTYSFGDLISAVPASHTLTVIATSSVPMTYQWYRVATDSSITPIAGATSDSYVVNVADGTNSGKYRVNVSNSYGVAFAETTVSFTIRNIYIGCDLRKTTQGVYQQALQICP
jgi:Immunoglobulin domain